MSAVMQNQPQTPAERIVFWVDYVLKFNGAEHLKTGATNLFYQYHMLDVYCLLLFVTFFLILVLKASCTFCYKRFCKSKVKQQ